MKKAIHPNYHPVIFYDLSSGHKRLIRSTYKGKEKMKWEDGTEYFVLKVEVSAYSHAFYLGKRNFLRKRGGNIAKFHKKYGKK